MKDSPIWLRRFSKLTSLSTLFLIFVGALVTSTGSGLSVPDWPLSYGMLFPPMVGGIFYEHGHRMVAATVGFFMLILAFWLGFKEKRLWVRVTGFAALGTVILQGILGGITVLFLLPTAVSVSHAVLSQTFFMLTLLIAYSLSKERTARENEVTPPSQIFVAKIALGVTFLIYTQLVIGALMRHTGSGLAIPYFPFLGHGGQSIPLFDEEMLKTINELRFKMNLDPVIMGQVILHFIHRILGFVIAFSIGFLTFQFFRQKLAHHKRLLVSIILLNILINVQITLGTFTIWTAKQPLITSFHVLTGAALLGMSTLFLLQAAPLSIRKLCVPC